MPRSERERKNLNVARGIASATLELLGGPTMWGAKLAKRIKEHWEGRKSRPQIFSPQDSLIPRPMLVERRRAIYRGLIRQRRKHR